MPTSRRSTRTTKNRAAVAPTLPGLEPNHESQCEVQELVRVEKSLQSIGFFAASSKNAPGVAKTPSTRIVSQMVKHPDGRRIQARAVITAPHELGLPTTADRDKYMALMKLVLDRRVQQGPISNPVRFSGYQLLRLLRLSLAGYHYDEINDWLKRMTATTIMSESIVFLADRKEYVSDIFHVFDQVTLYGQDRGEGGRAEEYEVYLSRWQLENINSGFLLQMDLNAYLELRRDIAKTLFGHLHVWFFASRGRTVEKDYKDFCELFHIRAWPHLSKIKQILSPSMDELIASGYLASWDVVRSSGTGDFKIILSPGNRLLATPALAGIAKKLAERTATPPMWMADLISRGVHEAMVRQLALDIPDEQPVDDQIDYADQIVRQNPKLRNPPGLYVAFLRDNIVVPPETVTRSRQRRQAAQQRDEQVQRLQEWAIEEKWESYCASLVEQYSQANREETAKLLDEKKWQVKKTYPHLPVDTIHSIAEGLVMQELRTLSGAPSLASYIRERPPREISVEN